MALKHTLRFSIWFFGLSVKLSELMTVILALFNLLTRSSAVYPKEKRNMMFIMGNKFRKNGVIMQTTFRSFSQVLKFGNTGCIKISTVVSTKIDAFILK